MKRLEKALQESFGEPLKWLVLLGENELDLHTSYDGNWPEDVFRHLPRQPHSIRSSFHWELRCPLLRLLKRERIPMSRAFNNQNTCWPV